MKIVMELKSDAIPGSGNSLAGIIDRDISYDKYGLPYVPAKRIKGILRESAEELDLNENALFGIEGDSKGCDFRISNGYLTEYKQYKKLLSSAYSKDKKISNFLPPQTVTEYFTYTRFQTTIENGIAKENSLRVSRVLKKGLIFEFEVEYNKNDKKNLEDICKVTRAFGGSRTRGFGEIKMEFITSNLKTSKNKQDINEIESSENTKISKFKIVITNKEQLLLSSKPGQSQVSENYINGSALLGIIAINYIKENGNNKNGVSENFYKLFLSGKLSFGNLYPIANKENTATLFFPSPLSIKKVKEDKNDITSNNFYDHSNLDEDKNNEILNGVIFKGGFPEFVSECCTKKADIIKNIEAHHRRPFNRHIAKSTKENGEFFQFEIIEADQVFAGEIIGEETLLTKIRKYFPANGQLRLGKSKTGQYGKCKYSIEEISEISNDKFEWNDGEEKKIIFRSDMILLNEYGFATPDINLFKQEFANKLGADTDNLEIIKQFSKTTNTGGFLGIWKMPRIQKPAISAGTVLVLKNNTGKILCCDNIKKMMFGDRIEDGFGRIAVYENKEQWLQNPEKETIESNQYFFESNTNEEIKKLINFQIEKIVMQNLELKAIKSVTKQIPINSFIAKLISYLKNSENFEKFNAKIKELKSNKQKANLIKISKELFIDNHNIAESSFNTQISQSENSIPDYIKKHFKQELTFKLYKHYALSYLTQLKYKNRGSR